MSRVLFVTRRFPPSIGGMQTLAAAVDRALRQAGPVELVALRSDSLLNLAWFLPLAAAKTLLSSRRDVDRLVCGDAVAWSAIAPFARAESTVMVHGLDLTYPNALYQRWLRRVLPRAGRVVANSSATAALAHERGVDPARIAVLNPGVESDDVSEAERARARAELVRRFGLDPDDLIVAALGRLVRRKGIEWFVRMVVPRVADVAVLLVAGEGPMRPEIETAIRDSGAAGSVRLLGNVDDRGRELLLRGADIFVMPNVRVHGDMEGFGLVAVEAASRGALVVAAGLEGITDAVIDGSTGILLEPERAEAFVETIRRLGAERMQLASLAQAYRQETRSRFSVERMEKELPAALGISRRP